MGAVGHTRGVDFAFLFIMAANDDDKLIQVKVSQEAAQNSLHVTKIMHIYVVQTELPEAADNYESPCQQS